MKQNVFRGYKYGIWFCSALFILSIFWMVIPSVSFNNPRSTVLFSKNDYLIGATLASDQQWRFPPEKSVGNKFKKALITYEDENFYNHWGIDIKAVARAIYLNIKRGHIVSGASTLSMQISRLALNNQDRTWWAKIKEGFATLKLEVQCSKEEILSLYANNAPFGGNIVGIEAASWRYFSCASSKLTWAESATLAVLPNAPALIYPGHNNKVLRKKRDFLLKKLYLKKVIDKQTYELSILEKLPQHVMPFPKDFIHAMEWLRRIDPGKSIHTALDPRLQDQILSRLANYSIKYKANQIHNVGVLVLSVKTGNVISYIGNSDWKDPNQGAVDMVQADRSTGSLLKPFLYAAMQDAGYITPNTIIPDYPVFLNGFAPKNFDRKFRGAVSASLALSESLNVPSVFMLRQYSAARFLHILHSMGLSSFDKRADYYGLSLILGGGESSLWQMVGAYASMSRALSYGEKNAIFAPSISSNISYKKHDSPLSKAAIWNTFQSLQTVNRPINEVGWKYLDSSSPLAWKTGTSYGFKDAWAIGVNPEYAIGVWVGNADGQGRPACTGVTMAAPILFDIFHFLPKTPWFSKPDSELFPLAVCHESGYSASKYCNNIDTLLVGEEVLKTEPCPYHKEIMLDKMQKYRVNNTNYPITKMVKKCWFILPPKIAYYYKQNHPEYHSLPPRFPSGKWNEQATVGILYPSQGLVVTTPRDFMGVATEVVFQATTTLDDTQLYWFLDGQSIGTTSIVHKISCSPSVGTHRLVVQDKNGNEDTVVFKVV
ncbi:penicillin-binding protein 1C [Halosquirtibacter laminarini]|uniref:Penicillin-binding protein 1C n=1 Tax=Halosquirtibacter laminarini TaxID=3374600 RepID=A0AC61NMM4_9BACT|nr:penicillin-binding protein 1C [Prolixibacteraceae bacterium]